MQALVKQLESRLSEPIEVPAPDLAPLESRIEKLELEHGERHLHVMNTLEKVVRQFGARERARKPDEGQVAAEGDHRPKGEAGELPAPSILPFRSLRSW